ncbi:MAG: type IV pilus twitching motility protein PilT [Deltaproteobacteria bacterium]|nr:type IV pilus twitching motility protein PilT [Deltaproteobacteria bacterium]
MGKATLRDLLKVMVERKASDLHVNVGIPPNLRIDGTLVPLTEHGTLDTAETERLCTEVLSPEQKKQLIENRELDLSFGLEQRCRIRANIYWQQGGMSGAFRNIPFTIPTFESLGLPSILMTLTERSRGLILVTGPTGSGKSTTLAAMIDRINAARHDHIITIEDPIEYIYTQKQCVINQREVGQDTKSFNAALKYVLRQDPNVVLIGEMRDLETIQNAITVAETGHLVFATLHTNNAVQTIDRIIDVFPPHHQPQVRTQLSFILEAVISQALMPRVGGGRVLGLEIMIPTHAIRNLIRENKTHQMYAQMQMGQEGTGMLTMNQSLARLVKENAITFEEGLRRAIDQEEFLQLTGRTHPRAGARAAGVTGSSPRG